MERDQIRKTDFDGRACYIITIIRSKNVAASSRRWDRSNTFWITGDMEIACIDEYMKCFPPLDQDVRFFRRLMRHCDSIVATRNHLGKNGAAEIGKRIARLLNLPNADDYTGRCFRRSSLTFCADAGMSSSQMKALSGHKSTAVLERYVEQSNVQKRTAAESVSLCSSDDAKRLKSSSSCGSSGGIVINIYSGPEI